MKFVDCQTDAAEYARVTGPCGGALPGFVTKDDESKTPLEKLSSVAFADQDNRLWPLHDKRATWLSIASYARQSVLGEHPSAQTVEANLDAAATLHDISDSEKNAAYSSALAAMDAIAAEEPETFGISIAGRDFKIPVSGGADELTKVACWMYDNARAIGFEARSNGAEDILAASLDYDYDLGEDMTSMLSKSAGLAGYTDESLKTGIQERLMRLGKFEEYMQGIGDHLDSSKLTFKEACLMLEAVDKEAGLDNLYADGDAALPEEAVSERLNDSADEASAAEIIPGITEQKLRDRAFDVATAMGLQSNDADAVVEAVKGMDPEKQQAVRQVLA